MLKESLSDSRKLRECVDELEIRGFRRATDTVKRFIIGLLNYRIAPQDHWRGIRTTNMLGRLKKELKRRSRALDPSPMTLRCSVLQEQFSLKLSMSGSRVGDIYLDLM